MKDSTIAEQLLRDGYVLTQSMGVSMRPMLTQQTEQLLIQTPKDKLKRNDVVLYRRRNGQYVLHRIVRVRGDRYGIRGDNCYGKPENVSSRQVIGILKGFYRGEKFIDCRENKGYRIYVLLWRATYPLRLAYHRCRELLCGVVRKLRR